MKPVNFYLVTDTHYFENELGAEGPAFEKITVDTIKRLFFIKKDKSFDDKKLTSLIGEVGVGIFLGDAPYVESTPVHTALSAVLDRFSFVLKKVKQKLAEKSNKVDLKKMLLDTVGNNKGFSDNNAEFTLK